MIDISKMIRGFFLRDPIFLGSIREDEDVIRFSIRFIATAITDLETDKYVSNFQYCTAWRDTKAYTKKGNLPGPADPVNFIY